MADLPESVEDKITDLYGEDVLQSIQNLTEEELTENQMEFYNQAEEVVHLDPLMDRYAERLQDDPETALQETLDDVQESAEKYQALMVQGFVSSYLKDREPGQ